MKLGSLCSGGGGLDMAVEAVFGAETVWHAETDPAASKVLAARWPGVPNYGDLTNVDWHSDHHCVEPIDILCAGWPCQPFSAAGKRKGAADERAIWPHIAGAIRILRPRIICLENVSAVLGPEFSRVANSLAALRYDLRWTCLRACDVGAPHQRQRVFIVATDTAVGGGASRFTESASDKGRQDADWRGTERTTGVAALLPTPVATDASDSARHTTTTGVAHAGTSLTDGTCLPSALLPTPEAKNSHAGPDYARMNRERSGGHDLVTAIAYEHITESRWGKYEPAIRRWEASTRPAPAPTEPNIKGNPRLHAPFAEWMMGWPEGWVTAVEGISRNDQLRIIGNGVVPQQAEAALRRLLSIAEVAAYG